MRTRIGCSFVLLSASLFFGGMPGVLTASDQCPSDKQLSDILNELREIRKMLKNEPTTGSTAQSGRVSIDFKGAPMLGSISAPLTLLEFTDYECAFCRRFYAQTFSLLKKEFIDTGKVRFVSMDLPLEIHKNAMSAAQAGRCAAEQNRFWELRGRMQEATAQLDLSGLSVLARDVGLEPDLLIPCVESQRYRVTIEQQVLEANRNGVHSTPTFIIGRSTEAGVEGELVVGTLSYEAFAAKLNSLGTH